MSGFLIGLANVLMVLTSIFLIGLVLIQRGKGGGLAGAFGGSGGSSAFGTKAGDVFTRVTIYVAIVWFALAMILVWVSNSAPTSAFNRGLEGTPTTPADATGIDAKPVVPPDVDGSKVVPPIPSTDAAEKPVAPVTAPKADAKPAAEAPAPVIPAADPAKKTP